MNRLLFVSSLILMNASLAYSDSLPKVGSLSSKDELAKVVKAIATQWGDNNITSGTTSVSAGRFKSELPTSKTELKLLAEALFKNEFKYQRSENFPNDVHLSTTVKNFKSSDVTDVAIAYSEGNAFDPESDEVNEYGERSAWVVLRKLDVSKTNTVVLKASARVQYDDGSEVLRHVNFFVFVNLDTFKYVQFFTIEGTM